MNKNSNVRHLEYYNLLATVDNLYERSKNNATHNLNLYDLVISENNILCAYRNIKSNKGSKTKGTDNINIKGYKEMSKEEFIWLVREKLKNYEPNTVKRRFILKANGKQRPLGIPTMLDRIIQQMFKQILEPIAEAKFHNHSYGFRPNRSARHAIARCQYLININKLHYVVNVDIKGFFDNVDHNKLIKQLYSIGIRDKRVLSIIRKMLKAPIENEGTQAKGVPQGGVLSPLLSNIVLNELDKWISSQWETHPTHKEYASVSGGYRELKKTKLKEMYIVRYADDFKVFTTNYKNAYKIMQAIKDFLKTRLKLDISEDKSKITNLKKNTSDFLGYTLRAVAKKNKYVARTGISKTKKQEIVDNAKKSIKRIKKNANTKNVNLYNSLVIGVKNYFKYATNVYIDLAEIEFKLLLAKLNGFARIGKRYKPKIEEMSETYKAYNPTNVFTYKVAKTLVHSFSGQSMTANRNFTQSITNYTSDGRELVKKLHQDVLIEMETLLRMSSHSKATMEYVDNRISRYSMQKGKCAVTQAFLFAEDVHCHHINPSENGGTDSFDNLVIVSKLIHKLIHATNNDTIQLYLNRLNLNEKQIKKLNAYREKCNLMII